MSADLINIDTTTAKKLLYQMMLIREFEDASAEQYSKGNIRGFLHLYSGEEAVAVGVMHWLGKDDTILSTYREHGHALVRGVEPRKIMAEMFGKVEGCSRGRGGSMHLFDVQRKFFGGNAIVAGHLPMAVGVALADKKLNRNAITCCFFGEGAVAEGEFHEAMNLAALWQVPLLFICENNQYAMGTAIKYTHARTDLEVKGASYGIDAVAVDGMDLRAVLQVAHNAAEFVRTNRKPFLLVCNTYRFRAHSMFDAQLYRTKEEVEEWKKRDPIPQFAQWVINEGKMLENDVALISSQVVNVISDAIKYAETGLFEPIDELTRYVYAEKVL